MSAGLPVLTRSIRSLADLELPESHEEQAQRAKKEAEKLKPSLTTAPSFPSSPPPAKPASKSQRKADAASNEIVLTLACPDQSGIVYAVTGFLAQRGFNIVNSDQFGDPTTDRFFMRVHATGLLPRGAYPSDPVEAETLRQTRMEELRADFARFLASPYDVVFHMHRADARPRTMIMVSKIGHCLNDLLFRHISGTLPIDIPLIVSNHKTYQSLAERHGIPFYHLPIDPATGKTKEWQESELMALVEKYNVELVVLARYMQILSDKLCTALSGQIINIHHSFLPSFKGARPYHQAYARGVKIIGATAHLVTADLDEGPIIEQDVERVTHSDSPSDLIQIGADIEARVLSRAVRWMAEHRVLPNGQKTVVFA